MKLLLLLTSILLTACTAVQAQSGLGQFGSCSAGAKSYGAKGDGSTDDTAALQNALTSNPGGTLCLPSGVYNISSCLKMPNKITIRGVGAVNNGYSTPSVQSSTIRLVGTNAACMIEPSDITDGNYQNFSIFQVGFDGGAGNGGYVTSTGAYLDLQNTYDMTELNDIMVFNFLNAPGIRIGPGTAGIGSGPIVKFDHIWVDGYTNATSLGASGGFNNQVGLEIDDSYEGHTGYVNGGVFSGVEVIGTGTAPGVRVHAVNGGAARWYSFQGLTIFGIANASTPAVELDGMINSGFHDSFLAVPAGGTGFLVTNGGGYSTPANLLFEGVFNDGPTINFIKDQKHGVTLTAPVGVYSLQ